MPSGLNSAANTLQVAAIQEAAEQIAELGEEQPAAEDAKVGVPGTAFWPDKSHLAAQPSETHFWRIGQTSLASS